MTKRINIGVLGCASIAERSVIPAIISLKEHFNLVAVASRSAVKAQQFASKFSCEGLDGYDKIISRPDIDALYIPLPTGLHSEWINKSLEHGKHVYAEKSIAMRFADAQLMVENARRNNTALMEGYMFQYHPQHQEVKRLLKEGVIGEVRHFSGAFGFPPLPHDNFRFDENIGGGVLMDAAGYPLRAAFVLMGDGLRVSSATLFRDRQKGTSLYGSAFLTGTEGVGISIAFGFDNFYQCNYVLWGSKGKLTAQRAYTPRRDEKPTLLIETPGNSEVIALDAADHFTLAMKEFHRIITTEGRDRHFFEILQQSESLELIRNLSS